MKKKLLHVSILAITFIGIPTWILPAQGNGEFSLFPGIRGSGKIVEKTFDFSNFNAVSIESGIKLNIRQSDRFSVVLKADDNAVDRIRVVKSGNTLKLSLPPNTDFTNVTAELTVGLPELKALNGSGGSQITIDMNDAGEIFLRYFQAVHALREESKAVRSALRHRAEAGTSSQEKPIRR